MLYDKLYLRHASMEDVDVLYEWRNDFECRKNSVNTGYIEYESHCKYLFGKLGSRCCSIFICMKESGEGYEPVGQARVDYGSGRDGEISYSVGAGYRCNGYGTKILALLEVNKDIREHADRLCAIVKNSNIASQKCFEKLGYIKRIKGNMVYYMKDL